MPAVLGAGAAAALLAAAVLAGGPSWRAARRSARPTPCGPPSLWADSARVSAPRARHVDRRSCRPPGRRRRAASRRPRGPARRPRATGWITPVSLLASIRATNGRPSAASQRARRSRQPGQVGDAVGVHRQMLDRQRRGLGGLQHGCHARWRETISRSTPAATALSMARALASVPPLVKITVEAGAADQGGDVRARLSPSGRAPRGRRRAPTTGCRPAQRLGRSGPRLGPDRRGGVVVEIDGVMRAAAAAQPAPSTTSARLTRGQVVLDAGWPRSSHRSWVRQRSPPVMQPLPGLGRSAWRAAARPRRGRCRRWWCRRPCGPAR